MGKNVLGEGNTAVIEALTTSGALLKEEEYAHKYPYDWRTKKPTIFRATAQVSGHLRESSAVARVARVRVYVNKRAVSGFTVLVKHESRHVKTRRARQLKGCWEFEKQTCSKRTSPQRVHVAAKKARGFNVNV